MGLVRVEVRGNTVVMAPLLGGEVQHYVSAGGRTLRRSDAGHEEPVATMALLTPQPEGRFIASGGFGGTWRQIPAWEAIAELVGGAWFLLALLAIALYAPFWMIGRWLRGARRGDRTLRVASLLPVAALVMAFLSVALGADDMLAAFGVPSVYSIGLCLATWGFAATTLTLAYCAFGPPSRAARPAVLWHGRFCAVGLLLGAAYLVYWGIIGIRTWT